MRWALALVLALLSGTGFVYAVTDGFTALTAEAARRRQVAHEPRPVPDAMLMTADGTAIRLREALRSDGRVAIVGFFYTRCVALCRAQGFITQQLQAVIQAQGLASRIRLISISFDLRERPPDLQRYGHDLQADAGLWQLGSFMRAPERDALLHQFGIVVVPLQFGDFEHNAALHVVTPDGRLAGIFDLDEPGRALRMAQRMSANRRAPHVGERS